MQVPQNLQSLKQTFNPRQWWTIVVVLAGLLLFTLVSAPSSPQSVGSTYSKAPEGYGAWYAYMETSGAKIERLRKPIDDKFFNENARNITVVQVLADDDSNYVGQYNNLAKAIEKGNRVVIIGSKKIPGGRTRATQANFNSNPITPNNGSITLQTSKRYLSSEAPVLAQPINPILKDDFGAIVLETKIGRGSILYVVPQFLGANAYQDTNNYAYLKTLVKNDRILVDEYIHGYRDAETAKEEGKADVFEFLAQTPLLLAVIQIIIIVLVLIYGKSWRLGPVKPLNAPPVNNSRAYIQALAGILQKANSTDFVTETLGKAELTKLQRSLGLSRTANPNPTELIGLWKQQTGKDSQTLERLLVSFRRQQKLSEAELTQWLALLQEVSRPTPPK
jgi:hypothetical protein